MSSNKRVGMMSPQIKTEPEDDLFGPSTSGFPDYATYSLPSWHSNGNISGCAPMSVFGSSNQANGFHGGNAVLSDDELGAFLDCSPSDGSQQTHMQTPAVPQGANQQTAAFVIPQTPADREHLNSLSFDDPYNDTFHSYYNNSADQKHRQFHFPPKPFRGTESASMPNHYNGYAPASYSGQMPAHPGSLENPTIALLQQQEQFGTSDRSSHGGQVPSKHRQRSSSSSQWSQPFDQAGSFSNDTPMTSPMSVPHTQGNYGSLQDHPRSVPSRSKPTGQKSQSMPSSGISKDDQKKARRRHAHNVVEQKRRDKINDRIGELASLVPPHRLEDAKLRKQNAINARAASAMNSGTSPPNASSLHRRSTSMSQTTPLDEREQTKGNTLDSAVAWQRDLMWLLQRKLEQNSIMQERLADHGIQVPFDIPDNELRMASELTIAMDKNSASNFQYSRDNGSGLYVPGYTDQIGRPLHAGFLDDYPQHGFQEPYPSLDTAAYSSSDGQGWMPGQEALEFINEEDNFEMEME